MYVEHKEAGEVTEQPAKVLKLSDAIRLGAKMHPQGFEGSFENGRTCAIGAAYVGMFGEPRVPPNSIFLTGDAVSKLKAAGIWPEGLDSTTVWRMNDGNRWSRERIADWLEAQGY